MTLSLTLDHVWRSSLHQTELGAENRTQKCNNRVNKCQRGKQLALLLLLYLESLVFAPVWSAVPRQDAMSASCTGKHSQSEEAMRMTDCGYESMR